MITIGSENVYTRGWAVLKPKNTPIVLRSTLREINKKIREKKRDVVPAGLNVIWLFYI